MVWDAAIEAASQRLRAVMRAALSFLLGVVIVPILYVLLQSLREWLKGLGKKGAPPKTA